MKTYIRHRGEHRLQVFLARYDKPVSRLAPTGRSLFGNRHCDIAQRRQTNDQVCHFFLQLYSVKPILVGREGQFAVAPFAPASAEEIRECVA